MSYDALLREIQVLAAYDAEQDRAAQLQDDLKAVLNAAEQFHGLPWTLDGDKLTIDVAAAAEYLRARPSVLPGTMYGIRPHRYPRNPEEDATLREFYRDRFPMTEAALRSVADYARDNTTPPTGGTR